MGDLIVSGPCLMTPAVSATLTTASVLGIGGRAAACHLGGYGTEHGRTMRSSGWHWVAATASDAHGRSPQCLASCAARDSRSASAELASSADVNMHTFSDAAAIRCCGRHATMTAALGKAAAAAG